MMTIELDDKSYIIGMWFSSDPKTNNDWLGCVIKDPDNPLKYKGWSRFRYTKDSKIFDNDDEKSWTTFTSQEGQTEKALIDYMEAAQMVIAPGYPVKDHLMVRGTLKDLIKLSKSKDWLNMKQVKA